ncbi:Hypothetical protein AAM4_1920 [Actinomyces succiniciruminis]|uniref:Prokaryotic membrane lipoprotein lipid attachment site profile n=2 Tax=Actinomyces succiniciruminis TaxID=1522002 RepID=A0A1L7RPY7_9ACTO|nr:Hypothetical protein AAM4_1920 [Actinomyces succiniciruminis]
MNLAHSLRSLLALVLTAFLLSACSHGGADQEATSTPEPIPTTALTLADVSGATSQTAHRGIRVETFCMGIENSVTITLLSEPFHTVTVEYKAGNATVYETLALNISTIRPNGSFASIAKDIAACDGNDLTTQYWSEYPLESGEGVFHATADLPDTLAGFTMTTTGEDGAQHHIERIYAAVTTNNGQEPGIIVLTTVSNTDQPGAPAPLDLLDAALQRADATLDPTAITTDLGPHTTPHPTNTP